MAQIKKALSLAALSIMLLVSVASCTTSDALDMSKVTSVIDVRTVEEFDTGHLEGALNIPVESTNFQEEISALDTAGKYIIYCRSGRRADIAIEQMKLLGFTDMTNLGSVANASAVTQLNVVQ
jgi:rhodanese-related sulfurtransferase